MSNRRMAGVTLVELIVAIAIMGVALAGLTAAYSRANRASADPLLTQQMLAIAEATMEEVMLKPFPQDGATRQPNRADFDDTDDYQAYGPAVVTDVNGDAMAGMDRYRVQVRVDRPGADGVPAIAGVPAAEARRVRVTVSGPGEPLELTGWRTKP